MCDGGMKGKWRCSQRYFASNEHGTSIDDELDRSVDGDKAAGTRKAGDTGTADDARGPGHTDEARSVGSHDESGAGETSRSSTTGARLRRVR